MQNFILSERYKQIIICLLSKSDMNRYISSDQLASEIYLSRSTLVKDIKNLNKYLQYYNLQIKGVNKLGYILEGNEINKRLFIINEIFEVFMESLNISEYHFSRKIEYLIKKSEEHYFIDTKKSDLFKKCLIITVLRCQKGIHITSPIKNYMNQFQNIEWVEDLKNYIFEDYKVNLTRYDTDFLIFPFNLGDFKLSHYYEGSVSYILDRMINEIYKEYQFYLDKNFINNEIYTHFIYMINRSIFKSPINISIDEKIELNYPFAYQIAKSACVYLEKELNTHIFYQEIGFLALYFQLAIRAKYDAPKIIGIIKTPETSMMKIAEDKMREMFKGDCEIIEVNLSDVGSLDISKCSALISAFPIEEQTNIPVIQLNNIFDNDYIEKRVDEGQRQNLIRNINVDYSPHFVLEDGEISYETYVFEILNRMKNEGKVNNDFIKKVIDTKKEKFGSDYTFLPHGVNKKSMKFIVDLNIIYSQEINKVLFITVLGIPEKVEDESNYLIVQIYDFLFHVIHLLNQASKNQSIYSILEEIKREGIING